MMELMIATRKAVPELLLEHGVAVDRVYTGSFMTSLDMAGIELTCLPIIKRNCYLFCMSVNMLENKKFSKLPFCLFVNMHTYKKKISS